MNSKSIKAVIFDLDGTLLNTLEDIADCANEVLLEFGIKPYPLDAYRHFVGNGLQALITRIMPEGTEKTALDAGVEKFREMYQLHWHEKTRPYPGVMEMLDSLQNTPISKGVLSNKPDAFTRHCVHYFFPAIHFQATAGNIAGVPLKPDPQSTIDMLHTLDTHPSRCLFVGDSSVDINTGRAAGTRTLGVTWGFRTEAELREAGADAVISSPEELLHHVITS